MGGIVGRLLAGAVAILEKAFPQHQGAVVLVQPRLCLADLPSAPIAVLQAYDTADRVVWAEFWREGDGESYIWSQDVRLGVDVAPRASGVLKRDDLTPLVIALVLHVHPQVDPGGPSV